MKLIIIIILSMITISAQEDTLSWKVDLNNNGELNLIKIEFINNSFHLKVDSVDYDLHSDQIFSIVNEKGNDELIYFADLNEDGKKEIILSIGHPIFENKSILKDFDVKNGELIAFKYQDSNGEIIKEMVALNHIILFNSNSDKIYIQNGMVYFNSKENETVFYHDISEYGWDERIGSIIKLGEKYFGKINLKELNKIIF